MVKFQPKMRRKCSGTRARRPEQRGSTVLGLRFPNTLGRKDKKELTGLKSVFLCFWSFSVDLY